MRCKKVVEIGGGSRGIYRAYRCIYYRGLFGYIIYSCMYSGTVGTGGKTSWVELFTLGVLCTGELVTVGTLVWLVFTADLLWGTCFILVIYR